MQTGTVAAQPETLAANSIAVGVTIVPKCSAPDVLESVSAEAPLKATLAVSRDADVKLVTEPLPSIAIACQAPTILKPMGRHISVTGIGRRVGIGDRFPLTLHFRDAGKVAMTAEVTSMAILDNVDPMNMRKHHRDMPGMKMAPGEMH